MTPAPWSSVGHSAKAAQRLEPLTADVARIAADPKFGVTGYCCHPLCARGGQRSGAGCRANGTKNWLRQAHETFRGPVNRSQFGNFAVDDDFVTVTWRIAAAACGQQFEFEWRETGVNIEGLSPWCGFGGQLSTAGAELRRMPEIEFLSGGLRYSFTPRWLRVRVALLALAIAVELLRRSTHG